jgi:hypothetical protein
MIRFIYSLLVLLTLSILAASSSTVCAQDLPEELGLTLKEEREIVPGLLYKQLVNDSTPVVVHVLRVDLKSPDLSLKPLIPQEDLGATEWLSDLVTSKSHRKHEVVAAINAGGAFTPDSIPEGLLAAEEEIFLSGAQGPSLAFLPSEGVIIDVLHTDVNISSLSSDDLPLGLINRMPDGLQPGIFTHRYPEKIVPPLANYALTLNPEFWILSASDELRASLSGFFEPDEVISVPETGFAAVVPFEKMDALSNGLSAKEDFQLTIQTHGETHPGIEHLNWAIEGKSWLVKQGEIAEKPVEHPVPAEDPALLPAPRTAVGIDVEQSRLFLITVDGWQAGHSFGMGLPRLSRLMKELGCRNAIEMEGGDASALWGAGEYLNQPSVPGGKEPGPLYLGVVFSGAVGAVETLSVDPANPVAFCGESISFKATATDDLGRKVSVPENLLRWEVSSGTITPEGVFGAPRQQDDILLTAYAEGALGTSVVCLQAQAFIRVVEPEDFRLKPSSTTIAEGEELKLQPQGLYAGQWMPMATGEVRWKIKGNAGSLSGSTFLAQKTGKAKIEARLDGMSAESRISVGLPFSAPLSDFGEISGWNIRGQNLVRAYCRLQSAPAALESSSKALLLQYEFGSESERGVLVLSKNIPLEKGTFRSVTLPVVEDSSMLCPQLIISDADGDIFLIAPEGSSWISGNTLRSFIFSYNKLYPVWTNPGAVVHPPVQLSGLMLSRTRAATKTSGTLLIGTPTIEYEPLLSGGE